MPVPSALVQDGVDPIAIREGELPGAIWAAWGQFGSSGAAARSAVVMNGLSAALRQAMNRSCAIARGGTPQVREGLNRIVEEHHAEARQDQVDTAGLERVHLCVGSDELCRYVVASLGA